MPDPSVPRTEASPESGRSFTLLVEEYKLVRAEIAARDAAQTQVLSLAVAALSAHAALAAGLASRGSLAGATYFLLASVCLTSSLLALVALRFDHLIRQASVYEARLVVPGLEAFGLSRSFLRYYYDTQLRGQRTSGLILFTWPPFVMMFIAGVACDTGWILNFLARRNWIAAPPPMVAKEIVAMAIGTLLFFTAVRLGWVHAMNDDELDKDRHQEEKVAHFRQKARCVLGLEPTEEASSTTAAGHEESQPDGG